MNWRIKVDGDAIVVTQSEHDEILDGIKSKMDLIGLREGKLLINPRFIRSMMETNEETEAQYSERVKGLPSPEEDINAKREPIRKLFVQSREEFYKRMKWPV